MVKSLRLERLKMSLVIPQTSTAKNFVSTVIRTEPSQSLRESFNDRDSEDYSDYKLFLDAKQIKHLY